MKEESGGALPEIRTYLERLRDRRAEILKTIDGLDAAALDWKPAPKETNAIAVLAVHTVGSERWWLHQIVGGKKVARDRDAEFHATARNVTALGEAYVVVAEETERMLSRLSPTDMEAGRKAGPGTRSVRWCILHVLEHYNEHIGQMQLTRQLWEQRQAQPPIGQDKEYER